MLKWLGTVLLISLPAFASQVFISEYVEPSAGNTKALEIYNGSGAAIDMAEYRIGKASNGAAAPTYFTLSGTVAAGDVFVACHSSADAAVLALADYTNGSLDWNGDDFVALYQVVSGSNVLIDAIGVLGTDPGTGWDVAGTTTGTLNHTLVRKPSVGQGNTNWSTSAGSTEANSEWVVHPAQTFGFLGSHSVEAGDLPPVIAELAHLPLLPLETEEVTVTAEVSDDQSVLSVTLVYTVDGGAAQSLAMTLGTAPSYSGVIPPQAVGAEVAFHVEAVDNASQTSSSATVTYTVQQPSLLHPGDLVISEIMKDPMQVTDALGEWFEVHNSTAAPLDLLGLEFKDTGSNSFTVSSSVVVAAGGFAVFCPNGNSGTNGGLSVDYVYPGASWFIGNGADAILILEGTTEIDRVAYTDGGLWPDPSGASMFLTDLQADNNDPANWAVSTLPYGLGDLGTPGADTPSDIPPSVSGLSFLPAAPHSTDAVTVSVNVTDDVALSSVNLVYTLDGGADQTVAMTAGTPPAYSCVIPAQPELTVVAFHVVATDDAAQSTTSSTLGYTVNDSFLCGNIAEMRVNDANGVPLMVDDVVSVCGVVTMGNQLDYTRGPVYITGETGSMAIYGATMISTGVVIGDEIHATGVIKNFNGLNELDPTSFAEVVGHPGEPTPLSLTLEQILLAPESYEARFVTVSDLTLDPASVWPTTGTNGTVTVLQGSESFTLFIDKETDIDGTPAPAGTFNLKAVIGQYDTSSPYLSGHQLIPRMLSDFVFVGNQPPSISAISHLPYVPDNTEAVNVTALVVDDVALTSVSLAYQVNGGGYSSLPMSVVSGDLYGASIPAQADGALVEYQITATDASETSSSATSAYTVHATFPCVDIATLHVNNAQGQPALLGTTQYVCGVLTCGGELGVGGPYYLVNETGSLALFGGAFNSTTAVIGDEIEAVATVGFYNGLTEMTNSPSVVVIGHPGAPSPLGTTLAALNAAPESFESMFVRLDGCTLVDPLQWPAAGSNAEVTISQGAETFTLHIDRDSNVDESTAPLGPFSVQGLVGQYDTATPWDANYQITPRRASDILTIPDAPLLNISYASGNVTLTWPAVPGAADYRVYSSASGYSGWDAGVSTVGATSYTTPSTGKAFFRVVASN